MKVAGSLTATGHHDSLLRRRRSAALYMLTRAVPRVRVNLPDELLQRAATRAQELGKHIDELYAEAIDRYVEVNKAASAGSLRSRAGMPRASPQLIIEIPEELFQRAEKLAKRLGKRRDVMYAEALAKHVSSAAAADSALNQGHDLPSGAWRPKGQNA
jgi:predicted DNA-binding protein